MALHRDIHWIGRQWAVTGFGMQAIDQKLGGKFDIEMARLWDDGLTECLREQTWFKAEDFEKGLAMARKRYPEPPRKTAPPPLPSPVLPPKAERVVPPAPEAPKPEAPRVPKVEWVEPPPRTAAPVKPELAKPEPVELPQPALSEFQAWIPGSARFARPWRVRMKR
ncbi:hypothetical protein [Bradyrhizobium sp.]|uniref:hypothetical protein n=1 Tax=Bradyrhizobium sp. TaxID=376 RepID=UPI003C73FD25